MKKKYLLIAAFFLLSATATCILVVKYKQKIYSAAHSISGATGLNIKKVTVEGSRFMDSNAILAGLNLAGKHTFSVQLKQLQETFAANPWAEEVTVMRIIPDTIVIKIKEKEPVAVFVDGNARYVVDINGRYIAEDEIGIFASLVKVKGDGALQKLEQLLNIINSEMLINKFVVQANWIGNRRWDFILHNNTEIKLPEESPMDAWRYIATLQQKKAILTSNPKVIDLRVKGKIFLHNNKNANPPTQYNTQSIKQPA